MKWLNTILMGLFFILGIIVGVTTVRIANDPTVYNIKPPDQGVREVMGDDYDYEVTRVIRVVDGDTYDLEVTKTLDFGFRLHETKSWATRFRLYGGDTFELNEVGGGAARRAAHSWLVSLLATGNLRASTEKDPDNFGRWLVTPYNTENGATLLDHLRINGHLDPDSKWNQ